MKQYRRVLAALCSCALLAFLALPTLTVTTSAAVEGYWQKTDHIVTKSYNSFLPGMSGIPGREEATTLVYSGGNGNYRVDRQKKSGTTADTASVSIPGDTYQPGQTISLDLWLSNSEFYALTCRALPGAAHGGEVREREVAPDNPFGNPFVNAIAGEGTDEYFSSAEFTIGSGQSSAGTFRVTVPGREDVSASQFCVVVNFSDNFYEGWTYTWMGDNPAVTPQPRPGDVHNTTTANNQGGEFTNTGSDATIPEILVVGAGGAAAALGGGAVAAANRRRRRDEDGDEGEEQEERKPSTFRMYFYKDFGDAIKRGEDPKYVYARMVETTGEGRQIDRPDLSERITITAGANGLTVAEYGMSGNYKCAAVSAAENLEADNAAVTFRFTGEGGTYTNDLWFRVVGDPCIEFPDKDRLAIYHVVNGLYADGETYEVPFILKDFSTDVDEENVRVSVQANDLIVSCEKTGEGESGQQPFKVIIKNRSPINYQMWRNPIIIEAVQGEERADSSFYFDLYPEGLSITGKTVKDGVLEIKSYIPEEIFDESLMIDQVNFTPVLAVAEIVDGRRMVRLVDVARETTLTIDKLCATRESLECFAAKYKYHIDTTALGSNGFVAFYPETHVPLSKTGAYDLILTISCDYPGVASLDQRVRILGEPLSPMAEKKIEYRNLRAIAKKCLPKEEADEYIRILDEVWSVRSKEELRIERKKLWIVWRDSVLEEGATAEAEAARCDFILDGLEWVKFMGDVAFSILVTMYAGSTAEAILSPAKDIMAEAAGETWWFIYKGQPFHLDDLQVFRNLDKMVENIICGNINVKNPLEWKNVFKTLGGLFIYKVYSCYMVNVQEKKEANLYGAIIEAFSSMTSATIKVMVGRSFVKLLNNATFKEKIGNRISAYVRDTLKVKCLQDSGMGKYLTYDANGNPWLRMPTGESVAAFNDNQVFKLMRVDVLQKYLEELMGKFSGEIWSTYTGTPGEPAGAYTYDFMVAEKNEMAQGPVYLRINLMKIPDMITLGASALGRYLWDSTFGGVELPEKEVTPPADPPVI